jgi:hypothetical protein
MYRIYVSTLDSLHAQGFCMASLDPEISAI